MPVISRRGRRAILRGRRRKNRSRFQSKKKKIESMLNVHLHRRFALTNSLAITAKTSGITFETLEEIFALDKVINYTELTALYDQYKINFVEIYMMWSPDYLHVATAATSGERANLVPPSLKIYHIADYDDANALTKDEFKERAKTQLTLLKPGMVKKITVKPAVLSQMYETLTSTGYAPKWNIKLDTEDPSVPHYSYKFGVEVPKVLPATSADIDLGHISFEFRYNLTMYNTK